MKVIVQKPNGYYEWSGEIRIQVYLMMMFLYAVQLICHRVCNLLEREKIKDTFVQKKKMELDIAFTRGKDMIRHLEVAYDATFDMTCSGANDRWSIIQKASNEMIRLCGLYQNRKDANPSKCAITGAAIQDAIRKMPADRTYDIDEVLKFYEN